MDRCLAFESFAGGPPNCTALTGCENPTEDPEIAIWPAVRDLGDDTFEFVDTCSGRAPVGLEPPFSLCEAGQVLPMTACGCACGEG